MSEYKITSYTEQKINNKTFEPIGRKIKKWAVYKLVCPFPNKSVASWEKVQGDFPSEAKAKAFLEILQN